MVLLSLLAFFVFVSKKPPPLICMCSTNILAFSLGAMWEAPARVGLHAVSSGDPLKIFQGEVMCTMLRSRKIVLAKSYRMDWVGVF